MKTIKSQSNLPEWFFNKQYKNNLTVEDWYYEIQWRLYHIELAKSPDWLAIAKNALSQPPDKTSFIFNELNLPPPKPLADFTQFNLAFAYFHEFENPNLPFYKQDNLKHHLEYLLSKYNHKDNKSHQALGYPLFFNIKKEQIANIKKTMDNTPPLSWWFYNDMFCREFKGVDGFPITVNLHYDDAYLLKEFKQWLASKRKSDKHSKLILSEKNRISENQISQWALGNYRQLIDLDCWAKWEGFKISGELLINTIWPNNITKTKESLKETRKQYRKVFSKRTLERLINQLKCDKGGNSSTPA